MKQVIDGAAYRRMMLHAAAATDNQKEKINELNVFPVPDGDTGTNMSLTLSAAAHDLETRAELTLSAAASVTASALLRGARGNSGVILSLLFRGFSKVFKEKEQADGADFAAALTAGVEAAYKAVMKPAEGTILTVSRLTAEAARSLAVENSAIEYVLENALTTAHEALQNTIEQNPVLKRAGVVDAGGAGFVAILEAMLAGLCEQAEPEQTASAEVPSVFESVGTQDITFTFDTVFTVRCADGEPPEAFRNYLSTIGDCIVIGEGDDSFKVHVHTDRPGDVLNEVCKYGTLELCKIENMRLQNEDLSSGRAPKNTDELEEAPEARPAAEEAFGAVAVCAGAGLADVFRDLGCAGIIEGGQTMNPSTEDILNAIEQTPAQTVFVLPNNKNIIMAAQAAAQLAEKNVIVIESKSVPQGISAMLAFDAEQSVEQNTEAMTGAMAGVDTLQITYAARNSDFDGHDIHEGDYLGLKNGAMLSITQDLTRMLTAIAEQLKADDKTYITVFYGADITEQQAQEAGALFSELLPDAEINVLNGGQPVYYFLISAE